MNKNEKARSTAATVKRAEAAALGGSAASFYGEFTTTTPARQVADFLPHGAANAVDGRSLATAMGFKSVRELSKRIERERRAGQPICAAVSGEHRGYPLIADTTGRNKKALCTTADQSKAQRAVTTNHHREVSTAIVPASRR